MKTEDLEAEIERLKSELEASIEREERIRSSKTITTRLVMLAKNPDSKLGKLIRSPRTLYRIATSKELRTELKQKKIAENRSINPTVPPANIEFILNKEGKKRINLLIGSSFEKNPIESAIFLAKKTKSELRIIFYNQTCDALKFKNYCKKEKIPEYPELAFYSSYDEQVRGENKFRIELSEEDIIITTTTDYLNE